MPGLMLANLVLGAALGLGSRAPVLILAGLAGVAQGELVCWVYGYSPAIGLLLAGAIVAILDVGYVIGSLTLVEYGPEPDLR